MHVLDERISARKLDKNPDSPATQPAPFRYSRHFIYLPISGECFEIAPGANPLQHAHANAPHTMGWRTARDPYGSDC
jgi:hypothetical protein